MIDVLLATYRPNEEWLKEQIDSIRAQKDVEVNLICREDVEGRGACQNFAVLLEESRAEYVAFSDQDDVWLEDKLSRALLKMHELEARYGKDVPLLVFADTRVVDANLRMIAASGFSYTKIDPRRILPRQLALQNVANGSTMLFNAALRDLAQPIPVGAFMHDAWCLLVAAVFGHIACVREAALLYRQHKDNVLGSKKVDGRYFLHRALQGRTVLRARLYANIRQVEAFVEKFGEASSPACFRALVGLDKKPYLVRVFTLLRNRIFKNGFLRNVGTLLIV
jgi:glycosyltransferase involved in cell wall biosynthesis